jgi:hypothetical protein
MKKLLLMLIIFSSALLCHAQQQLLSYEDLSFIIGNNLQKTDDMMLSKGYAPVNKKLKPGIKKYTKNFTDGSQSDIEIRADARKISVYIATDELEQYNLLNNSISPFILAKEYQGDVLIYKVKDLGNLYITVTDKVPFNPIKKDYDIQLVSDKNITAYN